jgi:hypothetical protein
VAAAAVLLLTGLVVWLHGRRVETDVRKIGTYSQRIEVLHDCVDHLAYKTSRLSSRLNELEADHANHHD